MFGPLDPVFSSKINMPEAKPKGGMFGGGGKFGIGEAIVHALNGYLASQGNPVGVHNMRAMLEAAQGKRQEARQEQQYQRQRQDGMADYEAKQQIEQRYAAPRVNDTVEDYNFRVQQLGKDAADEWLRNPPQYMNIPGVGLVQVPRASGGQAPTPTAPVGKLRPLGAGGPTPQASGGFPLPR